MKNENIKVRSSKIPNQIFFFFKEGLHDMVVFSSYLSISFHINFNNWSIELGRLKGCLALNINNALNYSTEEVYLNVKLRFIFLPAKALILPSNDYRFLNRGPHAVREAILSGTRSQILVMK